jgi:hypothetical protein
MAWLANTDIAPCTSEQGVIEYVIKYASRFEKQSLLYRDMARYLMNKINPDWAF